MDRRQEKIIEVGSRVKRMRMVEMTENIQQKAQTMNKEIIKLHIDQASAITERDEKIATLNATNELLEQQVLQLQMENEKLSSNYQEELSMRPKIIDKYNSACNQNEELKKFALECMAQSAKAKADCDLMVKSYMAADATVCSLKQQFVTIMEQAKSRINQQHSELKEKSEQLEVLFQMYQDSQAQLHMLQSQLEAARSNYSELSASKEETKNKLDAATKEQYKSEATISNLQREMRNMAGNTHSLLAEAKNVLMKKDNDLKSAADEIESLKKALSNQEHNTKMQSDRNDELQENLALAEQQLQGVAASNDEYKRKLEVAENIYREKAEEKLKSEKEKQAIEIQLEASKKSEATISNLQREMRNMAGNMHSLLAEAKNVLMKKDNDLKSAADEIESLKKALSNQEHLTKMQSDRNDELQENLALAEQQLQGVAASNDEYKRKIEVTEESYREKAEEKLKSEKEKQANLEKQLEASKKTIEEQKKQMESMGKEIQNLKCAYDIEVDCLKDETKLRAKRLQRYSHSSRSAHAQSTERSDSRRGTSNEYSYEESEEYEQTKPAAAAGSDDDGPIA